jgi:hypothetical protein
MPKNYISENSLLLSQEFKKSDFYRADIKFHGVDTAGASYEARIFLNNPAADDKTPKAEEHGYAGSFYVLGHGGCFGDVGHCDIPLKRRPFDLRRPHPLIPIDKTVTITSALRRVMAMTDSVKVTVVPIISSATDKCDLENVLKFSNFDIITYAS